MMDTIQVAIRVRPIIEREKNAPIFWKVENNVIYQIDEKGLPINDPYVFDKIFDESVDNPHIYNDSVHRLVTSALEGFNSTVFAYGQTSTGKSFTMTGSSNALGIIQLAVNHIFQIIEKSCDRKYLIRVSYIEIYNEKVNDLLFPSNVDLKVREDKEGNHFVGAKEEVTSNPKQVLNLLKLGNKTRKIAATDMNERSSRSHTILKIIIESTPTESDDQQCVQISHLHFVDLAGSERISQTKAAGHRLKEGVHINLSLSTLCNVIRQLSDNERFVNFRDSKLTRLLQHALGGNAKTLFIANVTPAACDDTNSTLSFAKSAKKIKNKPIINQVVSDQDKAKRYEALSAQYKLELENELRNKAELKEQMKSRDLLITELEIKLHAIDIFNSSKSQDITQLKKRRHTIGHGQEQGNFSIEDSHKPSLSSIPEEDATPAFSQAIPTPFFGRNIPEGPTVESLQQVIALKNKIIDKKDEELAALKNKLSTEDKVLTASVQAYMEAEIEHLKQALNTAYRELDDKESELKTIKTRTASLDESFRNLEEFTKLEKIFLEEEQKPNNKLESEIESLKSKNTEYESLLQSHEKRFAALKTANNDYKAKLRTLESDLKNTTKEFERVKMLNMQLAVDYDVQMNQLKKGFEQREAMYVDLLKNWEKKPAENQEHAVIELIGKLNKSEEENRKQNSEIQKLKDMIINKDLELAEKDAIIIEYDDKFAEQSMGKGEEIDFEDIQGRLHMIKDILLGDQEETTTYIESVKVKQLLAEKEEIEQKLINQEVQTILTELIVDIEQNDTKQCLELLTNLNHDLENNTKNKIEENQGLIKELEEEKRAKIDLSMKLELLKKDIKQMSVQLKQQSDLNEQVEVLRQELEKAREINNKYAIDLKEELEKQHALMIVENERIIQLDAAEKDLQRKDVQIDMLQNAIIQLETDMGELKARLKFEEELEAKVGEKAEVIKQLESEMEAKFRKCMKLSEESVEAHQILEDKMRLQLNMVEERKQSLEDLVESKQSEIGELQETVRVLRKENEDRSSEIQELRKLNEDSVEAYRILEDKMRLQLNMVEERKQSLEDLVESKQSEIGELQETVRVLRKENEDRSSEIQELRKLNEDSVEAYRILEDKMRLQLNMVEEKKQSLEDLVESKQSEIEDLQETVRVLREKMERDSVDDYQILESKVDEMRLQLMMIEKTKQSLSDLVERQKSEIEDLQETIRVLREEKENITSEVQEIRRLNKATVDEMQLQLKTTEDLVESQKSEIGELQETIRVLREEKENITSEVQEMRRLNKATVDEMQLQLKTTEDLVEIQKSEIEDLQETIRVLREEKENITSEVQEMRRLNKATVDEMQLQLKTTEDLVESQKSEIGELQETIRVLREEKENLTSEVQEMRRLNKATVDEMQLQLKTTEDLVEIQKSEIGELQETIRVLREEKENLTSEVQEMTKLNKATMDEMQFQLKTTEDLVESQKSEIGELQETVKVLREENKNRSSEVTNLEQEITDLKHKLKILKHKNNELEQETTTLQKEYNNLKALQEERLKTCSEDEEKLKVKKELESQRAETKHLQELVNNLNNQLINSHNKVKELMNGKLELEEYQERAKTELSKKNNEFLSLSKKLTKAYDELSEKELKIKELVAEKDMGFFKSNTLERDKNKLKAMEKNLQSYKEKYDAAKEDIQQKNIQIKELMAKVEESNSRSPTPQNLSPQELRKLRRQSLQDRSRSVSITQECENCTELTKKLSTMETLMLENRVDVLKLNETAKEKDLEFKKLANLKQSLENMLVKKCAVIKALRDENDELRIETRKSKLKATETLRKVKRQSLQDQNRSLDTDCESCEKLKMNAALTATEIDTLQKENNQLRAREIELEGYLKEENETIQTLERKLSLYTSSSESKKIEELDEQLLRLQNDLTSLNKKYKEAMSRLKEKEEELMELQADYEKLECKKKIVEASELKLTKKVEELSKQKLNKPNDLLKQLEDLKTKNKTLEFTLKTQIFENCDNCTANKIKEQELALKEYESHVKDLQQKCDDLTLEKTNKSMGFPELQAEIKRFQSKYQQACKLLRMRRTEILQLRECLGLGEDDEIPGTSQK